MGDRIEESLHGSRILVVDDDESNLRALDRLLRRDGYQRVATARSAAEALDLYRRIEPDMLVLDLHMPEVDGFQLLTELQGAIGSDAYFPVLVLTGDSSREARQRALAAGARDFLTKPYEPIELLLRVRNLLETRHLHLSLRRHAARLEETVAERTRELAETRLEILRRLAIAAEYRDDVTGRHAERVGIMSARLAATLGVSDDWRQLLRRAAPLHDVGKIGIPDAILLKPGPLTPKEFDVMKSHVTIGARILSGSSDPLLRMAREIALTHHERWDGMGYIGLVAGEIPLVGRVVALADAFDSLIHERPYKAAVPPQSAVERILGDSGSHFDPEVIEAFRSLVGEGGLDDEVVDVQGAGRDRLSSRGRSGRGPTPSSRGRVRPWSRTGGGSG